MWEDGDDFSANFNLHFLFLIFANILQKGNSEQICFFSQTSQKYSLAVLLFRKEPLVFHYASFLNLSRMPAIFKKKTSVIFYLAACVSQGFT